MAIAELIAHKLEVETKFSELRKVVATFESSANTIEKRLAEINAKLSDPDLDALSDEERTDLEELKGQFERDKAENELRKPDIQLLKNKIRSLSEELAKIREEIGKSNQADEKKMKNL